jgi:tRNA-dihydrouridine synthase
MICLILETTDDVDDIIDVGNGAIKDLRGKWYITIKNRTGITDFDNYTYQEVIDDKVVQTSIINWNKRHKRYDCLLKFSRCFPSARTQREWVERAVIMMVAD